MLDLRVLRYLVAVADEGSLTAASELVLVAQPSLSRQLRKLEYSLGFPLFDRSSNCLSLTSAGYVFAQESRSLISHAESVERIARRFADGLTERVVVHAPPTIVDDLVSPFIATELRASDPMIDVTPVPTTARFTPLEEGADIAIAFAPAPSRYISRILGTIPLFAQMPSGHRLACQDSIDMTELSSETVIALEGASRTRQLLVRGRNRVSQRGDEILSSPNPLAAQALAAAGRGVAVSTSMPRFGLRAVPLRTKGDVVEVQAWCAWRSGHHAAPVIEDLAERLASRYVRLIRSLSRQDHSDTKVNTSAT